MFAQTNGINTLSMLLFSKHSKIEDKMIMDEIALNTNTGGFVTADEYGLCIVSFG